MLLWSQRRRSRSRTKDIVEGVYVGSRVLSWLILDAWGVHKDFEVWVGLVWREVSEHVVGAVKAISDMCY